VCDIGMARYSDRCFPVTASGRRRSKKTTSAELKTYGVLLMVAKTIPITIGEVNRFKNL
jgi:hypothetical protein